MAFEKIGRFFGLAEDDDDFENDGYQAEESMQTSSLNKSNKVVSINGKHSQPQKINLFEPRIYSDVKDMATHLLQNQAIVVNFQKMDDVQSKRIVDFLSGTVFAVNGTIQRIGDNIFLCTPNSFIVEGNMADNIFETFE
ncbi:cell division protein SepF [Dellaglioa sp. BT-FLS60]